MYTRPPHLIYRTHWRVANKGFWTEMLGIGDFYYELAVQIVEICMSTRAQNGGYLSISELQNILMSKRKTQEISEYAHIFIIQCRC